MYIKSRGMGVPLGHISKIIHRTNAARLDPFDRLLIWESKLRWLAIVFLARKNWIPIHAIPRETLKVFE